MEQHRKHTHTHTHTQQATHAGRPCADNSINGTRTRGCASNGQVSKCTDAQPQHVSSHTLATSSNLDDQKPISPGRWARSLRGKRYRISPCSPLKQEVSENYRYPHTIETPSGIPSHTRARTQTHAHIRTRRRCNHENGYVGLRRARNHVLQSNIVSAAKDFVIKTRDILSAAIRARCCWKRLAAVCPERQAFKEKEDRP